MKDFQQLVEYCVAKIMAEKQHRWDGNPGMLPSGPTCAPTAYVPYHEPYILQKEALPEHGLAAFVIVEQIDHRGSDPQLRYELYVITTDDCRRIFEDHAYQREGSAKFSIEKLKPGVITILTRNGLLRLTLTGDQAPEPISQELTDAEAKGLINKIGPSLGYDYTSIYRAEGRMDFAVAIRTAENGSTYGYDTIYFIWKNPAGKICYENFGDTKSTKDYIRCDSISAAGDQITMKFSSGGSYSGKPWEKTLTRKIPT